MRLLKIEAVAETGARYVTWISPPRVLSVVQFPERTKLGGLAAVNVEDIDNAIISTEPAEAIVARLEALDEGNPTVA